MDGQKLPGADLVSDHTALAVSAQQVHDLVASVVDPEIPVLTISDLGILREVTVENGVVTCTITPTYSGCPAMAQIEADIRAVLSRHRFEAVEIRTVYLPAWTTDWMSEDGRRKLAEFGIAPPSVDSQVRCPRCQAGDSRVISRFGSTACKALMACSVCGEPFDRFKAL